ncbi:hypothetical protein ACHAW6_016004 [Cyclotella cf. meneghiniana]
MAESPATKDEIEQHHPLVIIGGGIGGLTLALCLDQVYNRAEGPNGGGGVPTAAANEREKLDIHVYESTAAYTKEAGGAIGLYPNGLRVLRNLSRGFSIERAIDDVDVKTESALDAGKHGDKSRQASVRYASAAPTLLSNVRAAGCPYIYRRWMRHDGTEVAVAREDELLTDVLCPSADQGTDNSQDAAAATLKQGGHENSLAGIRADRRPRGGSFRVLKETLDAVRERLSGISLASETTASNVDSDATTSTGRSASDRSSSGSRNKQLSASRKRMVEAELLSLGIRRWKYQQVLYEACQSVGIVIHFGKRLQSISAFEKDGDVNSLLTFKDGSRVTASLVIGADGINSKVRNYVVNPSNDPEASQKIEEYVPEYTGVTCLMGCASVPRMRGICFPSSATTKCHACYYPTLVPEHGSKENIADEQQYEQVFQIYFPSPIERPDTWRTLTPEEAKVECRDLAKKLREDGWDEQFLKPLESETLNGVLRVGLRTREALDFWHAGGLSLLLSRYCPLDKKISDNTTAHATIDYTHFHKAMQTYESLRVTRTRTILGSSVQLGQTQQKRAESRLYNAFREWSIKAQVWAHGTLPVMRPGAAFDYVGKVKESLREDTSTD